ncbi:hypothetical protein ABZX93_35135 [Streptomyces sp. NPDC006632]|uniref:hypothetical protein n=1 Tax=Streptomyces sp. NPDC006632 TaxID=3157182 RepID=UPI0033B2E813
MTCRIALIDPAALTELAELVLADAAARLDLATAIAGHDWGCAAPVTPEQDKAERARTAQARDCALNSDAAANAADAAPPRAGLIEDMERDDNRRGPEPEDSALRLRTVIHCPVRGEQR